MNLVFAFKSWTLQNTNKLGPTIGVVGYFKGLVCKLDFRAPWYGGEGQATDDLIEFA